MKNECKYTQIMDKSNNITQNPAIVRSLQGKSNNSSNNDSPTQKDYAHATQSSPNLDPEKSESVIKKRQLSVKSNTWTGHRLDLKSSPPQLPQPGGDEEEDSYLQDEDDSMPRVEPMIDSQVELNREKDRIALWQNENHRKRINFQPNSVDHISDSDGPTQKIYNEEDEEEDCNNKINDDDLPTQKVNKAEDEVSETQKVDCSSDAFTQQVADIELTSEGPVSEGPTQQVDVNENEDDEPMTQVIGTNDEDNDNQPTQLTHENAVLQVNSTPVGYKNDNNYNDNNKDDEERIVSSDDESTNNNKKQKKRMVITPTTAVIAKKRKLDHITPARPLQFEVMGSTPRGDILQRGTHERVPKKSRLAEETPITRSVVQRGDMVNREEEEEKHKNVFTLGDFAWVRWTNDKCFPVKTVNKGLKKLEFNIRELGSINDRVEVIFGDNKTGDATVSHLYPLDLQVGDNVKYEDDKKSNFVVKELKYSENCGSFYTFCGKEKNCAVLSNSKNTQVIEAPIYKLYMVRKLWGKYLKSRNLEKNDLDDSAAVAALLYSPQRRKTATVVKYEESLDERVASIYDNNDKNKNNGIFKNCVFAVTFDSKKPGGAGADERIIRKVETNGGIVLKDGFRNMFIIEKNTVRLKEEYANVKFVAVLANTYRRTNKYIEALALGWPCLAYHYIEQCIEKKQLLDNWNSYVLAAGESEVLQNFVISADMTSFRNSADNKMTLEKIFENRFKIMKEIDMIYMIEPSNTKTMKDDSRDTFRFLLLVCGVGELKTCENDATGGEVCVENYNTTNPNHDLIVSRTKTRTIYSRQWVVQSIINGRVLSY